MNLSTRAQRLGVLVLGAACLCAWGCSATPEVERPRGLQPQITQAAEQFIDDLLELGVPGHSHFGLFVPEGAVNKRALRKFLRALENGFRQATGDTSLGLMTSADKVFLLSEVKPEGWDSQLSRESAALLASEFRRGTHEGWVAFHTFWKQFNRLAVGDRTWIDRLPDSIRADLAHKLEFILRVDVSLDENPSTTEYRHSLSLQFVEVGSERSLHAATYPITVTYSIP